MRPFSRLSTIGFLVVVLMLPQSYLTLRAFCLAVFLVAHLWMLLGRRTIAVYVRHAVFYYLLVIVGVTWSLIGLWYRNDVTGVLATLKLYSGWSVAYLLIITLMRNYDTIETLDVAIVWAGLGVSVITVIGVVDAYFQLGVISEGVRKELGLTFGFDAGYIRIHSHNIASLFFITPYLVATRLHRGARQLKTALATPALLLTLIVAVISGRRALWLTIAMTPLLIVAFGYVTHAARRLTRLGGGLVTSYVVAAPLVGAGYLALFGRPTGGVADYFSSAFSAADERTIQEGFLLDAFREHPALGTGFGASAGYIRNDAMPWMYELSYHQILFNFGLVGSLVLLAGLLYYSYLATRAIAGSGNESPIPFGILVGFYGMLIGAYSNPYFGYFDSLIFVALLVYLTTLSDSSTSLALHLGRATVKKDVG